MRLKPWLKLILIVLALLLSAASPGPSAPPKAKQSESATEFHQTANNDQTQNTPQAYSPVTAIPKTIPGQEPKPITVVIQRQPYSHWWQAPSAPEWASFLLTIPYVVVTIGLFVVTLKATRVATLSANAAEAALHSDRPYLLANIEGIESFKYGLLEERPPITRVDVRFVNAGSSPAELIEVIATSWKFDCWQDASDPTWKILISGQQIEIVPPVVRIAQSTKPIHIQINWTQEDMNLVNSGLKRVAIYGIARYCGGPRKEYHTRFFWWFSPLTSPQLQKAFEPELNERT